MITFYPDIKLVHIGAALTSGLLFALRGLGVSLGMRWPRVAPLRYLGYTVDTVLLTAAMMLLTILPAGLFANGWLIAKVGFILAYVVLGVLAFQPARGKVSRVVLYAAALLCFLQVYGIARTHHPMGLLALPG
ncbi:SirB2 family protein [Pseudoxanthomonas beigongshangi]